MRSLQKVLHISNFQFYNFLFWALLCVFEISKTYSFIFFYEYPFKTEQIIIWPISRYIIYWFLSYYIFDIYLKTRQKKKVEFIIYHVFTALLYSIIHKVLSDISGVLLQRLVLGQDSGSFNDIIQRWNSIFLDIPGNFFFYWGIVILLLGLDYYRKFVDEHTRYLEMESQLSRAQLKSLKMQLNPHFLFNAFNTISMMIRQEKGETAVKMISGLSDMLRHSLVAEPKQFVSLYEEVDLLKKYLLLESERYKDRLVIEWDVDESLLMHEVPSLIFQPIVENAFKHGISKNMGKSLLKISIKKENQSLILEVFNTGSFLPINWDINKNKGLGLANTINRLIKLYQKDYKIQISEKNQGVAVKVRIPIISTLMTENSIDNER
jgi:hypothetical protein